MYEIANQTPLQVLNNYFLSLYSSIINGVLVLLTALVVFFFGWLVAVLVKWILEFVLSKIQIKEWFKRAGLSKYVEDFTWEERLDKILAEIGFFVVLIVFLMASLDILGLSAVSSFIRSVVNYIPKAVAGGLILLAGFLFGELTRKAVSGILRGLEKKSASGVGVFIKWVIVVFAFLAALNTWGVAVEIVNTLAMGIVLFVALAGGLAFGLGGQEIAREILENVKRHFRS
jgi:sensor histidine kinase YesM